MFDHAGISKYEFNRVPLDRDIFLMDEKWASDYEKMLLNVFSGGDWGYPGFISYAAIRSILSDSLELSWYPNLHNRFHEMRVTLHRSQFVTCVAPKDYDDKPRLFVNGDWLNNLHLLPNSIFALVDAAGVKKALLSGAIKSTQLSRLQELIDAIASKHPEIAFVSFADSLLLKLNWFAGMHSSGVSYNYEPERIIRVLPELEEAYRETLGLPIYSVVTQGRNEFYQELIHVSSSGNHLSLNSLGLPFAQLQTMESAVRAAIRSGLHKASNLYMDDHLFHSLNWKSSFYSEKGSKPEYPYLVPMSKHPCAYVVSDIRQVITKLES